MTKNANEENIATEGLTTAEVEERRNSGRVNGKQNLQTKSVGKIIRTNVCTLFNAINICLAVLILVMSNGKEWNDTLFMGIVFFNLGVGILQELRAKHTIEKLSLISAPKVAVKRDGGEVEIPVEDIVMDDIMVLEAGRQICADAIVISGSVEVNESMITGESDPIVKKAGEELLSGSFVVSGKCEAKVIRVGAEGYASKIASGARYIKKTNSEILRSLRAIIRLMSIIVVPLGVALLLKQYFVDKSSMTEAVLKMSGSVVSMIPQGLVALSTTVFAVGVIRLSKHNTLSQDLYSIETLARVDVLCLDKTGTITEGSMVVVDVVAAEGTVEETENALALLATNMQDNNPTYNAVVAKYGNIDAEKNADELFAFSSLRKWSGFNQGEKGIVMGAIEFIAPDKAPAYTSLIEENSKQGKRMICVAECSKISNYELKDAKILGFALIEDKIRDEASATLAYFAEQGVDIRIISGDNPITVSAIAAKAGLEGAERYTDASTWTDETNVAEMISKYKIFGRVTPEQKLAIIKTLKAAGHTVAMTGDGVNDVLALKEADCSVAMAAGSDVARSVSSLVLLDNNFASMPKIVAEGRRSINNLQRSSSLYLVKTIYAVLLAIIFLFIGSYPFEPAHLTLVGATSIGLPSFFLALEPNKERAEGSFIYNALRKALPGSLTIVLGIVAIQIIGKFVPISTEESDMMSILMVAGTSFMVLFRVCLPMDVKHAAIFFGMLILYFMGWLILPDMFNMMAIKDVTPKMMRIVLPLIAAGVPILVLFVLLERKLNKGRSEKLLKRLKLD